MLTRLVVRNFKRFGEARVELGQTVLLIGPNNAGKTSALQALALWQLGLRRWLEKRGDRAVPDKRPGVTINRRDLVAVPIPVANLLWRDLKTRLIRKEPGKQHTQNILIEVLVEGVTDENTWACGLEFDYANAEAFFCRPMKLDNGERMLVPKEAKSVNVAFLPPMSGLAVDETKLTDGAIEVRIGEGRTAEVLRNLSLAVHQNSDAWEELKRRMRDLFGIELLVPQFIAERGEVRMQYREPQSGAVLDLSCAGRGFQQTLLLTAYILTRPNSVILLDEPDAHLEILRQRQTYQLLTRLARERSCQIVAASHSEVLLNEAADRDVVIAFVGDPHRIDDRGTQTLKALREIGFEHYLKAEQRGWVIYLEGATDLAILQAFSDTLDHPCRTLLEAAFYHYVGNQISKAQSHYWGLRDAKPDLEGIAILDRDDRPTSARDGFEVFYWPRREIENYLCQPEVLEAYAGSLATSLSAGPLLDFVDRSRYRDAMRQAIEDYVPPRALRDRADSWWNDTKASTDFLDRVFPAFLQAIGLPAGLMTKTNYHELARFVPPAMISDDIRTALDMIAAVAARAHPRAVAP
jgi:ABC-type taurine transport system ATPase subunit